MNNYNEYLKELNEYEKAKSYQREVTSSITVLEKLLQSCPNINKFIKSNFDEELEVNLDQINDDISNLVDKLENIENILGRIVDFNS
jgi:Mg2+ and Co2+ transporter CorA